MKLLQQAMRLGSRFQDDEIWRWRCQIELKRRVNTAHMNFHMCFGHAAVGGHAFYRLGDPVGDAECLYRNARHGTQVLHRADFVVDCRFAVRLVVISKVAHLFFLSGITR